MKRWLILLIFLLPLTSPVKAASPSLFDPCSQPLILFNEFRDSDQPWLNCLTGRGQLNLGIQGSGSGLSPSKKWMVYTRGHGPMRRNGKELFGYTSLFVYDLTSKQETALLTDMGNIIYFWIPGTDELMIHFWLNTLGSYDLEQATYFIYNAFTRQFKEMKWPDGLMLGYFPSEDRYLLATASELFTVSPREIGKSEPFQLPHEAFPYGIIVSPDGELVAYTNWQDSEAFVFDRHTGESIDITKYVSDNRGAGRILSFSGSGKYLVFANDSVDGILSLLEKRVVFSRKHDPEQVFEHAWLTDMDVLLITDETSKSPLTTDIYSVDAASGTLKRLTRTATFKTLD